jgi:hypothetical protein
MNKPLFDRAVVHYCEHVSRDLKKYFDKLYLEVDQKNGIPPTSPFGNRIEEITEYLVARSLVEYLNLLSERYGGQLHVLEQAHSILTSPPTE